MAMSRLCVLNVVKSNIRSHLNAANKTSTNFRRIKCDSFRNPSVNFVRTITSKQQPAQAETEREYLVRIKNDPDVFGRAAEKDQERDETDLEHERYLENPPSAEQKLRTKQYADMIKAFVQKKQIKEAIDVLEVRMIKEDRVQPESYIFNLILGACGRVGYTKKAFSLYNKMKQRGLTATGGTYTALFNACANSPWKEDGLTRAKHLREVMLEKAYEPNDTNYNAMIKAFGRCGDLKTAFALADEMHSKNFRIGADTINFLLQACISDTEAGFRHSLLVWRKFIQKRIAPTIYSYNLLLKCVRECGLGDVEVTKDVIDRILLGGKSNVHLLEADSSSLVSHEPAQENRPNLLARDPHLGDVLSLLEVKTPEDRLILLGGCSGFLHDMLDNHCTPDIKTFTQLIECIPSTLAAEKELTLAMKRLNIKADVDFYNILIKKRSMRGDYESAQEVLRMIKGDRLKPDLVTYGVLALGCKTREEAQALMLRMSEAKYRMNIVILGAMLHQACYHLNVPYVLEIMETCIKEEIRPSKKFMECLEELKKKCKQTANNNNDDSSKSRAFQKGFTIFRMRYKTWKEEVHPVSEDEEHPWQQFRQNIETCVEHYKDKEAGSRFKPRHTSVFKQKNRIVNVKQKKIEAKYANKKKSAVKDDKTLNYKYQINAT